MDTSVRLCALGLWNVSRVTSRITPVAKRTKNAPNTIGVVERRDRIFCDSAILRVLLSSARKKPGLYSQLLMLVLAVTIPLSNVLMRHCKKTPLSRKNRQDMAHTCFCRVQSQDHTYNPVGSVRYSWSKNRTRWSVPRAPVWHLASPWHTQQLQQQGEGKGQTPNWTLSKAFGGVFTVHFSDVLTAQKIHIYTYSVCDYNPKLRLLDCEIFFACEVRGFLQDEIFSKHARIINSSVIAFHMYKGDGVEEEIELSLPSV